MSRIIGILERALHTNPPGSASALLSRSSSSEEWRSEVAQKGRASFGWTGWRTPNIARVDGLLVVIDGSIYNRGEFEPAETDANLFAALYLKRGFAGALTQLNGDFAIALFDSRSDTLWIGRDRFGVKPLYYVGTSEYFAFASRPNALRALAGVSWGINRKYVALFAASHYRYFDNAPEQSPWEEIRQLPAAQMLRVCDGQVSKSTYWSLCDVPDAENSEAELAEAYRAMLLDAVALRVKAAHRPAFTLSGGMDSSSVLASAVRLTGQKQHAYSTIYTDKTYDESAEIRPMLDVAVEQWHSISIGTPDVVSLVDRMIRIHDEPVATATWLSHFLLCEEASRQGFGSLFGGLGGDELNAGEYEYFFYHFADLKQAGKTQELDQEIARWVECHDHPIFRKSPAVAEDTLSRVVDLKVPGGCLPDRRRLERYAAALNPDFFDLGSFIPKMDHLFRSYLKNRTYQDITRETIPCCLRAEDRQTTAYGLDNILPFFDHRLVEFMFRVPGKLKIRNGVTKRLLRQAMQGIVPEETRARIKKTGWNAPAHVWFVGRGRAQLMDLVRSKTFRDSGIYNVQEVDQIILDHERIVTSGVREENHMMFLWQLLNLMIWLQHQAELSGRAREGH